MAHDCPKSLPDELSNKNPINQMTTLLRISQVSGHWYERQWARCRQSTVLKMIAFPHLYICGRDRRGAVGRWLGFTFSLFNMPQASIKGLLLVLCALLLGGRCDVHRALTLTASHRAGSLKQATSPDYRHRTRRLNTASF